MQGSKRVIGRDDCAASDCEAQTGQTPECVTVHGLGG